MNSDEFNHIMTGSFNFRTCISCGCVYDPAATWYADIKDKDYLVGLCNKCAKVSDNQPKGL